MDILSTFHHECVIFLTGAPLPGRTDFGSSDNLVETYLPAFCRFLGKPNQPNDEEIRDATTSLSHARSRPANWRFIPITGNLLPSFNEQVQLLGTTATPKVPLSGLSCKGNVDFSENHLTDSPYKDLNESSYVWHNNINCSQDIAREDDPDSTVSVACSSYTMICLYLTHSKVEQSFGENIIPKILQDQHLHLVPLSGLPSAGEVDRLMPQTVTVSLLVIALKVDFKCQLRTRRTGQRFDLVEISVGDDTQNNFSINIWLKSSLPSSESTDTAECSVQMNKSRSTINLIKTGDLLLLENVALATWKGCIYGQNLRKRVGNIETKIHIIERTQLDSPSSTNLATRITKVKDWAMKYVGNERNNLDDTENEPLFLTHVPADTQ